MITRIRDIAFTAHPYERDVLILLAWFRACFVTATGIWAWWAIWYRLDVNPEVKIVLTVIGLAGEAFVAALVSADFLERALKRHFLGYVYNPRVMAGGELEGWTGGVLLDATLEDLWERHKTDQLYFRVLPEDVAALAALGYSAVPGGFFRCLWEGEPGSGRFGEE